MNEPPVVVVIALTLAIGMFFFLKALDKRLKK